MQQNPETELLLLCARTRIDDKSIQHIHSLLQMDLNWTFIFQLAEYHRTNPLLARHLNHHARDLLAENIQAELHNHHRDSTQHNLVLAMEVIRIVDLFSKARISVVPFKGPVSAILVYGDMAMRACGDIDLLVKPDDHNRAEQLLLKEGYFVEVRYDDALQSSLRHKTRHINIDLHWGIPPEKLRLDSDQLWGQLKPVDLLGRSILTFSPCATLLVTAVNAVKAHDKPSLHLLSDIDALTADYTDKDWLKAFRLSREVGCQRALVSAMLFAHQVIGTPLPSVGPARLFNNKSIRKIADELQDQFLSQSSTDDTGKKTNIIHYRNTASYDAALIDSPWIRNIEKCKWLCTPNVADREFIRLPGKLSFLYVFIRPLRLLIKVVTGRASPSSS